jgi:hypothetical protein
MQNRKLIGVDEEAVYYKAREVSKKLWKRL